MRYGRRPVPAWHFGPSHTDIPANRLAGRKGAAAGRAPGEGDGEGGGGVKAAGLSQALLLGPVGQSGLKAAAQQLYGMILKSFLTATFVLVHPAGSSCSPLEVVQG
uniref:HDC17358 n=1 Tax=Drosophila melanogaster TaxID=7227 RepID=Q6IIQ3_DROME|nr:TPA_inf: HDC17358 [Drosophila melanogaster]